MSRESIYQKLTELESAVGETHELVNEDVAAYLKQIIRIANKIEVDIVHVTTLGPKHVWPA